MCNWKHLALLFTVYFHCACAESPTYKIPGFVEVCYRDDPKLIECIKRNIVKVPAALREDSSYVRQLKFEPVDPFSYKDVPFTYTGSLTAGTAMLKSGFVRGLSNFKLLDVRTNMGNAKKFILDFDAHFPHINIYSDYNLIGHVIKIPVDIKGRSDLHFEGVNATVHMAGDAVKREGREYLNLTSITWRSTDLKYAYVANDDVVHGYPSLNIVLKNLISTSWRQLHDFMSPALATSSGPFIRDRLQKHFDKYPYDAILPEKRKIN